MKYLQKEIYDKMRNDSTLTNLIDYNVSTNANIFFGATKDIIQNYEKSITFWFNAPISLTDLDQPTSAWREYAIMIKSCVTGDIETLDDITERLITLFEDTSFSSSNIVTALVEWDGFSSSIFFDEEINRWVNILRIKVLLRKK